MVKFNLEKALNGAKVITRDGREVTQLHLFDASDEEFPLNGVIDNVVYDFRADGTYLSKNEDELDLFMAPEMLSGFICYHIDGSTMFFKEKPCKRMYEDDLVLIVDLSQFTVGHGLEDE